MAPPESGKFIQNVQLNVKDEEGAKKLYEAARKIQAYSLKNEPGVLTYRPAIAYDGKSVIIWEEYASKQALDEHMQLDLVKDLLAILPSVASGPPLLGHYSEE